MIKTRICLGKGIDQTPEDPNYSTHRYYSIQIDGPSTKTLLEKIPLEERRSRSIDQILAATVSALIESKIQPAQVAFVTGGLELREGEIKAFSRHLERYNKRSQLPDKLYTDHYSGQTMSFAIAGN